MTKEDRRLAKEALEIARTISDQLCGISNQLQQIHDELVDVETAINESAAKIVREA